SYEEYYPFGASSYRSGPSATEVALKRYRYVGKERDEETGLYYYGARYYAAWLARFVSVDPLKDDYPQLNSYNYAGNKPITFKDIDGQQSPGDDKRPPENKQSFMIKRDEDNNITSVSITTEKDIVRGENGEIISSSVNTSTFTNVGDLLGSEELANLPGELIDSLARELEPFLPEDLNELLEYNPGNQILNSLLAARDANIRLRSYIPQVKELPGRFLGDIDNARNLNDLEFAESLSREAVKTRNDLRTKTQNRLSPQGKAASKVLDQPRSFNQIANKIDTRGVNPRSFEFHEEIVKSAGRSRGDGAKGISKLGTLKNLSRAGRTLGILGTALGIYTGTKAVIDAPEDKKGEVAAEEIGGFALGTVGGIVGGIAGAALAGVLLGAAAPAIAVLAIGAAVGFAAGYLLGNLGRSIGRGIYFSF
ncbi:MAG: RHS repeat-associated core domain-containing protein, partial [Bacteroidota bacterium]